MRPNFDPHLRDGFDDIPTPCPTLGQHDRIARGAAARGERTAARAPAQALPPAARRRRGGRVDVSDDVHSS